MPQAKRKRSASQLKHTIRKAEKSLLLEVSIDGEVYAFEADMFRLDNSNIGILNEQISEIPSMVAYVGVAHSLAKRWYEREKEAFEMWRAQKMTKYYADMKTDKAKENALRTQFGKDYEERYEGVRESAYVVSVLEAYRKGMQARQELSQTMSANIREERTAYKSE